MPPKLKVYKRDNKEYTIQDVMAIAKLTYKSAALRLNRWESGEISTEKLLTTNRLSQQTYKRDDKIYTIQQVVNVVGLGRKAAKIRLTKWVNRECTTKQLFRKRRGLSKNVTDKQPTKRKYQKYATDLLSQIPGPTEYEKQHPELLGSVGTEDVCRLR